MTHTKDEALKLALEAMERYQVKRQDFDRFADEITAVKQALAAPVQELTNLQRHEQNVQKFLAAQPAPTVQEPFGLYEDGIFRISAQGGPSVWRTRREYSGPLYTSPPAQPAPVPDETMQKLRETLESPSYNHALAYQNIRDALEIVMRWIDDYCETGPENDFERVEKIAEAALSTPPAQPAPVPLTDEQIADIQTAANLNWVNLNCREHRDVFARAIEAAHGITEKGRP